MEKWKIEIEKLNSGECYTIPESDYGKAEVYFINDVYLLFGIPTFGGEPYFVQHFVADEKGISELLKMVNGWT
jgi:hypothetical protein